ncbi:MAG TPA: hydroxymethylbilane synthase [Stellaceae bacterium]|nr:hydroxymethylbilane synthase [Stellaceae bacterium]
MARPLLRIGTRGSALALAQAAELAARLAAAHAPLAEPGAIETVVIKTTGDQVKDRTLAAIGGKGLFTKEIEEALLAARIDLAVHSLKDLPTFLPDGLVLACHLPREDPRDAFFAPRATGLADLAAGAVIGTASPRRHAQLLHRRPDLRIVPLRGNVDTRLKKLDSGVIDATVLAVAGVKRLGLADRITAIIPPDEMLPAVAQGAIGIEIRADDARARAYLAPLDHAATASCVTAERAVLAALGGSCRTPVAALAEIDGDALDLRAMIIRPDGSECLSTARRGAIAAAAALGGDAGAELRARAGPGFFGAELPEETPV